MSDKSTDDRARVTSEEAEEIMAKGESVSLGPPPDKKTTMSVYHIRLEDSILDALGKLALMLDETPSSIARRILREGVSCELARTRQSGTRDQVLVQLDKLREVITSQPEITSLTTWEPASSPPGVVFETYEDYGGSKEVK